VSRWTDPDKWKSKSFRKRTPQQKLVLFYIKDMCNNAGFIEFDPEDCAFRTGLQLGVVEKAFEELSDVMDSDGDWHYLREFLAEQRNLPLRNNNNAHGSIIRLITEMKNKFPKVYKELILANGLDKPVERKKKPMDKSNYDSVDARGAMR
jgi:hypothetical protein